MKQNVLSKRNYLIVTALLIIIIGLIPVVEDSGNYLRLDQVEIKTIVLNQVKGLLDSSTPVSEQFSDFAWLANMIPTPNSGGLFNPRQTLPVWERVLLTKQAFTSAGYFCAIMIIALFFIFYQGSRTGAEEDGYFTN